MEGGEPGDSSLLDMCQREYGKTGEKMVPVSATKVHGKTGKELVPVAGMKMVTVEVGSMREERGEQRNMKCLCSVEKKTFSRVG